MSVAEISRNLRCIAISPNSVKALIPAGHTEEGPLRFNDCQEWVGLCGRRRREASPALSKFFTALLILTVGCFAMNRLLLSQAMAQAFLGQPGQSPFGRLQLFLDHSKDSRADSSTAAIAGRLVKMRDALPRRDLNTIIAAQGGTPTEQFTYVRDKIRLDAYAGAMRGALGAVNSHSGNPVDKALLLAALLKRSGAEVRFARASLEESDLTQLVDAARTPPLGLPSEMKTSFEASDVDRILADVPEAQRRTLQTSLLRANDAAQSLRAKAEVLDNDIITTLDGANIALGDDASLRSDAAAALRDHVWVQFKNGSEWQDLDPSLPTLDAGQRMPTVRTITTSESLPDDLYVTLDIRVVATRMTKNATTDDDIIDATRRVVDVAAEPLMLEVRPDSDGALKDLPHAATFRGHLRIAHDNVDGDQFVIDDPDKGSLLALTMITTVKRPAVRALTYIRSLVDRRATNGGGIAAEWGDPQRVACSLTSQFLGLVVTGRLPLTDYWKRQLTELSTLEEAHANPQQLTPSGGFADAYPHAALRYFFRAQSLPVANGRFVIDRPNIGFERTGLDCLGDKFYLRKTLDIMENGQAAIMADMATAARSSVLRGALAEAIETSFDGANPEGLDSPSLFVAASRANIPVIVLQPGQERALKALSFPSAYQRGISSTLKAGQVAIVTRSLVFVGNAFHVAWWAVEPASGDTIGRVDDGGGQALTEQTMSLVNNIISLRNTVFTGWALNACVWNGATYALAGNSFDVGGCAAKVACKLATDDTIDVGFSMYGLLAESEYTAETLDLIANDLDLYGIVDVSGTVCGT